MGELKEAGIELEDIQGNAPSASKEVSSDGPPAPAKA
jgi:hypothetical protein